MNLNSTKQSKKKLRNFLLSCPNINKYVKLLLFHQLYIYIYIYIQLKRFKGDKLKDLPYKYDSIIDRFSISSQDGLKKHSENKKSEFFLNMLNRK